MKKTLMLLISVLLLAIMVACSNGSNDGPAKGTDELNEPEGQPAEEAAQINPDAAPEMDFDLGGRTLRFVSWFSMELGVEDPDSIQKKANLEALMEKHNFKVEYITLDFGEYRDKAVASLMAGEPIGEFLRMGKKYMIPSLVKQDLFWPIDEYTKNSNVFNQKITNEFSQFEGRGYGFNDQGNLITGIYYNRTLMNSLGLKPIQEYVNEDNWTWETFIQVAKEANRDTDNDGRLDTWGLANRGFLSQALASNETDLVVNGEHNLDDPKVIEALTFISRLAVENVARPSEGGDWTEPRTFFIQGNTLMYAGAGYEAGGLKEEMSDYDVGFVPFPKGPHATTYHAVEPDVQFLAIPKTFPNPEQLLYIYEKIHDIDSIYDYPDQASLESTFSNEDDIDNARMAGDNMRVTENHDTYPSLPYYEFLDELQSGVSVSTVIEKYKAPFQAAFDEVWKN